MSAYCLKIVKSRLSLVSGKGGFISSSLPYLKFWLDALKFMGFKNRIKKEFVKQKARDFVSTFASKQECWDYLESLGVEWRKSKDAKINDKRAMKALIGEYLYGLDPSLAKTTEHYISKARMERFTWHEGDLQFFKTKEELEKYYSEKYPDRKVVWKD